MRNENITDEERYYYGKEKHHSFTYLDRIFLSRYMELPIFDKIKRIIKEDDCCLWYISELINIYYLAQYQSRLKGSFAEIGTFHGTSSAVIAEAKGDNPFYTIDSFEGLLDASEGDNINFHSGTYPSSYTTTKQRLSRYKDIHILKGFFPRDTSVTNITDKYKYSFVHLDCDTYSSIYNSLKYFKERMVEGGIILLHDYPESEGCKRAANQHFKVIQINFNQGVIFI